MLTYDATRMVTFYLIAFSVCKSLNLLNSEINWRLQISHLYLRLCASVSDMEEKFPEQTQFKSLVATVMNILM